MPRAGDQFIVELKSAHCEWGTLRYTGTREIINGEGYIQIPLHEAERLLIYNSNFNGVDQLGVNLFNCITTDGSFRGILKSTGCKTAGDVYAKQFNEYDNLKGIGRWYANCGAKVGDLIKVQWTSPTEIVITHIPQP